MNIPFSWGFDNWPEDVYPYNGVAGRHLVRQNQEELHRCSALARPGHKLVIFGAAYAKWLHSKSNRVFTGDEYSIGSHRPEHAAKRFGNAAKGAAPEAKTA
jgi:hypothetical protein